MSITVNLLVPNSMAEPFPTDTEGNATPPPDFYLEQLEDRLDRLSSEELPGVGLVFLDGDGTENRGDLPRRVTVF